MLESCSRHPNEMGIALCRRCGASWCGHCLVYAFGSNKAPFCMSCAMVAGGVRTTAALPAMPRRMAKAQRRAVKAEAKAAAQTADAPDSAAEPERGVAAAGGGADWSTPWWEAREPVLAD